MKITKKLIKEIEKEAKQYFEGASGCHDWTHVERVRSVALNIGKKKEPIWQFLKLLQSYMTLAEKKK